MKTIKQTFWGYLAALTLLWWLVDNTQWSALADIFAWRNVLSQLSGVLGIGVMSFAMLLAIRPPFFETRLGGLDKLYRLHKWLGIAGLSLAITHWLIANAPKWAVALGWLERRGRRQRASFPEGSLQQLFASQRGLAEGIGEWAFYAAVLLMVLALLKRFPYRRFVQTHRWLALAYLALVFHSVILIKFDYWATPLGLVMAALIAAGSVGAVLVLLRRHVGGHRVAGQVAAIERHPALKSLSVEVALNGGWPGHRPGQFAFVTFDGKEGAHPFTIASRWAGDGRLHFVIKALGDYTAALPGKLKVGAPVIVEGPYGRFDFAGTRRRQIWVAGGIGITPFIARLQELAQRPDGRHVDLFHATADHDPAQDERLARAADAAGVGLHVLWDKRDGRLDFARLKEMVPAWREADVWFCGPAGFGRQLRTAMVAAGLPGEHFHQELFEMR